MIRMVYVNKKKIPVPIPIQTLYEAVSWVEATLVLDGHTITNVILDDDIVFDENGFEQDCALTERSKLEFQIDSPIDLAVQTLEAIQNLTSVVGASLKQLAVECWQSKPSDYPKDIDGVIDDLELIRDLFSHVKELFDRNVVQFGLMLDYAEGVASHLVSIKMAVSNSDWRALARILLNRLEPALKDLTAETEAFQIRIMAQSKELSRSMAPSGT